MPCAINPSIYGEVKKFSLLFRTAAPFPHIVIDNFLDESVANALIENFPDNSSMHRCHHYLFANKRELSSWNKISSSFDSLHQNLLSEQFQSFIRAISGEDLFMDAEFCGDLHQGSDGGFLKMHTDFNLHPSQDTWVHRLNVMIYLNKNWQQEYNGDLQLRKGLKGGIKEISPVFNRCVIMLSDDTTYHGYTRLNLPQNMTRKSIVVHFYKEESPNKVPRRKMTTWAPDEESFLLNENSTKLYNSLTSLKNRLLGSSAAYKAKRNK